MNSPSATEKDTRSTAVSVPSGVSKRLTMSSTTRIGCADVMGMAALPVRSGDTVALAIARTISRGGPGHARERRHHGRGVAGLHPHVDDSDFAVFHGDDGLGE